MGREISVALFAKLVAFVQIHKIILQFCSSIPAEENNVKEKGCRRQITLRWYKTSY